MHDDTTVSMTIRASTSEKGKQNDAEEAIDGNCILNCACSSFPYSRYSIHYHSHTLSQYTLGQLYNTKMMDFETLAKSTKIPPSLTTSSSVGPVPTVIPAPGASLQEVHTTGKRTLWYVILHLKSWIRVYR